MVESETICPKWHFGQVGHGGKNTIWVFFFPKFLLKKVVLSCSVLFEPIYNLSRDELVALHEYLNENLKKRFI
jgi:hypothetical protein